MALPGWILLSIVAHVIIALIFIISLLYYHYKSNTIAVQIATKVDRHLKDFGYDAAPFLVEWFNDLSTVVKMDYPPKTVCVVVLSNADMFEKALPKYIAEHDPEYKESSDLVDACTKHFMSKAASDLFPDEDVEIVYDWELQGNTRLPKITMTSAGHAAGLAYYNRPEEITDKTWAKKMYGCSVSPKYGGWFGFRAVLVFKNVEDSKIEYLPPHDAVETQELKTQLLEKFNLEWKDPAWRDIIYTDKRYSDEQLDYFNTVPADRIPKLKQMMGYHVNEEEKKDI